MSEAPELEAPSDYAEGWLIEDFNSEPCDARYLSLAEDTSAFELTWTKDHERAMRFGRREDAENYARCNLDELPVRICEHAWGSPVSRAAELLALRRKLPTYHAALRGVVDTAFETFKARNGKQVSIEGDDGEKCFIIPFDAMFAVRCALGELP